MGRSTTVITKLITSVDEAIAEHQNGRIRSGGRRADDLLRLRQRAAKQRKVMEDNDDFERIAGKTRTESAELRRQSGAKRSQDWVRQVIAVFLNPLFLAVSFAIVIGFVLFQLFR